MDIARLLGQLMLMSDALQYSAAGLKVAVRDQRERIVAPKLF